MFALVAEVLEPAPGASPACSNSASKGAFSRPVAEAAPSPMPRDARPSKAADKDEPPAFIDRCLIKHSQPWLSPPAGAVAQSPAAKPEHSPQGQRQYPKNHDEREQDFERVSLSE